MSSPPPLYQELVDPSYPPLFRQSAVPNILRRAFKAEKYARQFMSGKIRFGLLHYYRQMEGYRRDETEGRASIRWNLSSQNPDRCDVNYSGTSLDPYYILCTVHPTVCKCHLTANFGTFIVSINDPLKLLARICSAWKGDLRSSSAPFITPVLYNKDELVSPPPYLLAPPCLVYAQKHAIHSKDREYRYVLGCKVGTDKEPFITLDAGNCTDICSLVV